MRLFDDCFGHLGVSPLLESVMALRSVLFEDVLAIFVMVIGLSSGRGCEALF